MSSLFADDELPTPDTSHLRKGGFEHVYEPAEDTFLMLDALQQDFGPRAQHNHDHDHAPLVPRVCLEIGPGSGIVTTFLAQMLGRANALCLAVDINTRAAEATAQTAQYNGDQTVDVLVGDLTGGLRLAGLVDVLVFNPPYVVTEDEEVTSSRDISAAWAGGLRGRRVTDRLLPLVASILSPTGRFYLLTIDENDPAEIAAILARDGLHCRTALRRRAHNEFQSILCFSRQPPPTN
ncbi:methylase [Capsaspora owczarzaki ATCC 30864]|uniref:methylase n=1 Tax=Capsaspora owczarzaki (strain ATCC 30864) TaxID=595528 RepID=UPI0001FE3711|nr:methylase [Capsaspora owczarzaki ATCC 30864]|eukprot:XP_004363802.1 methylase [Capsaspora owczarzaki ATCC 30864]